MHHFEYHPKSPQILQIAKDKYPYLTQEWLSDESIEARYHLLEYLSKEYSWHGVLEKEKNGKPIEFIIHNWEWITVLYWSISHCAHYIAFIIADTPVGIDIAEYHERDTSLLSIHRDSEYSILWGKNWHNFYILWTAKEAIIKSIGGELDDMRDIWLIYSQGENISEFAMESKKYRIQSIIHDQYIISYLVS